MKEHTAEERGMYLFTEVSFLSLPSLAKEYIDFLSKKYGFCGELLFMGLCHYAQAVEGLDSKDDLYTIDKQGKKWFKDNKKDE